MAGISDGHALRRLGDRIIISARPAGCAGRGSTSAGFPPVETAGRVLIAGRPAEPAFARELKMALTIKMSAMNC